MNRELLSTRRQLELLRDLQRHAAARYDAEEATARAYRTAIAAAEKAHATSTATHDQQHQRSLGELEQSIAATREQLESQYRLTRDEIQCEYQRLRDATEAKFKTTTTDADAQRKQVSWQAMSIFDGRKDEPRQWLSTAQADLARQAQMAAQVEGEVHQILASRKLESLLAAIDPVAPPRAASTYESLLALGKNELDTAKQCAQRLYDDAASGWCEGPRPYLLGLGLFATSVVAAGLGLGWQSQWAWVTGPVIGVLLSAATWFGLKRIARANSARYSAEFGRQLAGARGSLQEAALAATAESRAAAARLLADRDREVAEAEALCRETIDRATQEYRTELDRLSADYPGRLHRIRDEHQRQLEQLDRMLATKFAETHVQRDTDRRNTDQELARARLEAEQLRDASFAALSADWGSACRMVTESLDSMQATCRQRFPDWQSVDYSAWSQPTSPIEAIQLGQLQLPLAKVKHGVSPDPRLSFGRESLELPAVMTLAEHPTLVVTAPPVARAKAIAVLQSMLLRFATAMPPGKVRLTLFDPVSMGESFSALMHLADFDETLVSKQIWSQPRDVEEQLMRLTAHMETILQKYLRSEFATIHEYNAQAGEVAEPFHLLAIADFPQSLTDSGMKRFMSLLTGGPRCGIYVLLHSVPSVRLPGDVKFEELAANAMHLDWNAETGKFGWRYPLMEHLELTLADPPSADRQVKLWRMIGESARSAIRVQVPFSVVAPAPSRIWQMSSAHELRVPVGRAGANRLQYASLGKGTSQHLLVAGKTGSGKSTFLHALITSGALHYSPQELEFYLVDFKKGVEFKSYATHGLPHARVVAIESEREFGLSVLQRLDEVLRDRGQQFREAGVQSLAEFRTARPQTPMPRVLLVVDEFQELFVEDDKLGQDAALLLDRLVRQGRAFGMHVLLGSQTLAGAYSLARATLGQMAVRVALACSEADAHLILSDERNQAARFLSRPGEAIYNDQNGLTSANQPFQVVWIDDHERAARLAAIEAHATVLGLSSPPPVVFEGNLPSDPSRSKALAAFQSACSQPRVSLGDPVAIADEVTVEFPRTGGSNLLVIGQHEPEAIGMLVAATAALALQLPDARIDLLDGSRDGESAHEVWGELASLLPQSVRYWDPTRVVELVEEVAIELAERDQSGGSSAPPRFLLIYHLARFRELRRGDDDFGFSFDKPKTTPLDRRLAELLRNGPNVGMHTLLWCDSYTAMLRVFERSALREFDNRVVLAMSAADSTNLLDSPAAARLHEHRALLYRDETGGVEKFRPFGHRDFAWLRGRVAPITEIR